MGLAVGNVDVAFPLLQDWNFDALMTHNRFTLVNRNADALIDYAAKRGVAVINAAPYAGGVLAKGASAYRRYVYQEAAEAALAPVRRVEEICVRNGVPPGAAALQFSLNDKRIAMTVCGISRPERVSETLAWARFPISRCGLAGTRRAALCDRGPRSDARVPVRLDCSQGPRPR